MTDMPEKIWVWPRTERSGFYHTHANPNKNTHLYISWREHSRLLHGAPRPIESVPVDDAHNPRLLWSPSTHRYWIIGRYWGQTKTWNADEELSVLKPTLWLPVPPIPKQERER
jgi:hypothetical protein